MKPRLHSALIACCLLAFPLALAAQSEPAGSDVNRTPDVIYVPTPPEVVDEMLRMAEVGPKDLVYDLGCGDGRLVIMAAKEYGARGVGIDIDPQRISESKVNAVKAGVTDRVKFLRQDLFTSDFHDATAVTLYLLNSLNLKLRPILLKQLKPGTPIVSHDFHMDDWEPDQKKEMNGHQIYLWYVPANVAGTWKMNSGPKPLQINLEQQFQKLKGNATVGGNEVQIANGKVRGSEVSFSVPQMGEFVGRFVGGRLEGGFHGGQQAANKVVLTRASATAAGR